MLYYINKRLFNLTSQLINKCVPIYVYIFTLIIFRFYNFDAGFSRAPVSPVINQSINQLSGYNIGFDISIQNLVKWNCFALKTAK